MTSRDFMKSPYRPEGYEPRTSVSYVARTTTSRSAERGKVARSDVGRPTSVGRKLHDDCSIYLSPCAYCPFRDPSTAR